jgi:hypothetical protein
MIKYKAGVPNHVLSQECSLAAGKLSAWLEEHHKVDLVITSTSDGKHMKNSKHYDVPCNAFDVRIWDILRRVTTHMSRILGPDFDVILEKDHIHVEYDPS